MFPLHLGLTVWLLPVVPFQLQNIGTCLFFSTSTTDVSAFSIFELVMVKPVFFPLFLTYVWVISQA